MEMRMRVVALQDGSLATSRNYNHESSTAEGGQILILILIFSDKDSYNVIRDRQGSYLSTCEL